MFAVWLPYPLALRINGLIDTSNQSLKSCSRLLLELSLFLLWQIEHIMIVIVFILYFQPFHVA